MRKKNDLLFWLLTLSLSFPVFSVNLEDIDLIYHSRQTTFSSRYAGLANSGSALPGGVMSAFLNPALPRAFAIENDLKGLSAGVEYGRDNVYRNHIFPAGISYSNSEAGTYGVAARYLEGGSDKKEYDAMLFYSGKLFDQSTTQGRVDFGIALRYEKARWSTGRPDTLFNKRFVNGTVDSNSIETGAVYNGNGEIVDQRFICDIGFYQSNVANNLDFGLVLYNVFGHRWLSEKPRVVGEQTTQNDSIADSTYEYLSKAEKTDAWLQKHSRRMKVGLLFSSEVLEGKMTLRIPLDVDFFGIFDRDYKTKLTIRFGVEATYREFISARFGLARQPEEVLRSDSKLPKNTTVITGGAALHIKMIQADFNFARGVIGVGIGINY